MEDAVKKITCADFRLELETHLDSYLNNHKYQVGFDFDLTNVLMCFSIHCDAESGLCCIRPLLYWKMRR